MVRKATKRVKSPDPIGAIARTPSRTTQPKAPDVTETDPKTGPESTQAPKQDPNGAPGRISPFRVPEGDSEARDSPAEPRTIPNTQTRIHRIADTGQPVPDTATTHPTAPVTTQPPTSPTAKLDKRTIARLRTQLRGDAGRYARSCEDMQLARHEWEQTAATALNQGCPLPIIQSAAYEAGLTDADVPDWANNH